MLLITYRSPVLWLLPIISAGVALTVAQAVIYLLAKHAGLIVNAQSAGILTVLVFGAGTDYALLLGRPLPRGAAPARGPARGDGGRAAPGRPGDHGQRRHRRRRHALPAGRRDQLHRGPRPGGRDRHRRRPARHDHAAAGAAGDLRPLDLLAAAPDVRLRRADQPTGVWARLGRAHRPPARALVWVATAVVLGVHGARPDPAQRRTACPRGPVLHRPKPDSVVGEEVARPALPGRAGQPVVVIGQRRGQAAQVAGRWPPRAGIGDGRPTRWSRAGWSTCRARCQRSPDSTAAHATVDRVRAAVHAVPGRRRQGRRQHRDQSGRAATPTATTTADHPAGAAGRAAHPGLLLRAVVAPLLLIATVVLSFAAALGRQRAGVPRTSSASPARTRRCRCSCSCSWSRWASTTTSS